MKTAISLPDRTFRAAERLAKQLKLSRSELYARAIQQYLNDHDRQELIKRMNAVCEKVDTSLDPALRAAQARAVGPEEW